MEKNMNITKIISFMTALLLFSYSNYTFAQKNNQTPQKQPVIEINETAPTPTVNEVVVSIGTFKNKSTAPDSEVSSLVDRITNAIVNTRNFKVVDNARLKEIIEEQQKVNLGLSQTNGKEAKQGHVLNAAYVIYGTVMAIGNNTTTMSGEGYHASKYDASCNLNLRITDAETGRILGSEIINAYAVRSNIESSNTSTTGNTRKQLIQRAEENAANEVVNKLMNLAFPIEVIAIEPSGVFLDMSEQRAKIGMELEVYSLGPKLIDPNTGASLGREEILKGKIKINQIFPKYAVAVSVAGSQGGIMKGMICRVMTEKQIIEQNEDKLAKQKKAFSSRF